MEPSSRDIKSKNFEFECIQCKCSTASAVFLECEDYYLNKPYRASYFRCENCGLTQQSPIPADVASFYDGYPIHQKKSLLYSLIRRWIMSGCYFNTKKFLSKRKELPLLVDFGCGDGWFLDASRERKIRLVGFEVEKKLAAHLSKTLELPVFSDEESLVRKYRGKADVVTMHFVLEHLTDINRAFETVHKLLKTDGVFYFVIPNISSWEARIFGKKWHNLDSPRHISFPEDLSVKQLSARWGFEVSKQLGVPFPNGIAGSIPVMLSGRFKFSLFILFLPLGILLSRIFPSGNIAYWLKKRPEEKAIA